MCSGGGDGLAVSQVFMFFWMPDSPTFLHTTEVKDVGRF